MADQTIPDPSPEPIPESAPEPSQPKPPRRVVYESTLLPARKRRRVSPWVVVPGLLLVLMAALYYLVFAPRPRRAVDTAGMVVYTVQSGKPAVSHLWISHFDGSDAHPLTSGAASDSAPTFTPDGFQLAFLSDRIGGQNQIYLMDADGKNLTQITRNAGAKLLPAFAPGSNTLLGFLVGGTLAITDVNQGDTQLILPAPGQISHPDSTDPSQSQEPSATVSSFVWKPSPDKTNPGLAAVLEGNGMQLLAVQPQLSSPARLTQTDQPGSPSLAAADNVSPAWAPDGSSLVVAMLHVFGVPGERKISGLFQFDPLGNPQSRLFLMPPDSDTGPENPVFSPDGALIAVELWRQPDLASRVRLGLLLVPAAGGQPRFLVKGDAGEAQFSPDGQQIFFLRHRPDGSHDLCCINTDGSGLRHVSDGRLDVTGFTLSPQITKP